MTDPTRTDRLVSGGLGFGLLALYVSGACRTIYVGDSGELVAAVHTLGIPHPSGYPLYVLLGKLWSLLVPVGSVAWRMSLFSAACAAAACALLYTLCRRLECDHWASALAALVLAFGPSFWSQATIQRVYALNALLLVLTLRAALAWYRERRPALLCLAAFASALGATNHTFMGIVCIVVLAWAATLERNLLRAPRALAAVAGSVVAGLTPYLYLPLRSAVEPRLDWGNPETPAAVLGVVLRREFWSRRYIEGLGDLLPITGEYARALLVETAWIGPALVVIGLLGRRRHRTFLVLPILIATANLATVALHGSRSDIFIWHRYLIPSFAMAALLAGVGAQALSERLRRPTALALLLLPGVLLATGFHDFDRSRYRVADDYSRRVLASLPPGSTLVASDDNILFVLIYLQLVEQVRPDVDLILQGVGKAHLPTLRVDPEQDPIFFTHPPSWRMPGLALVPCGQVFRIWRRDLPALAPEIDRRPLAGENDPRIPRDYLTANLIGHFHYMLGLDLADRDWPDAEVEFRRARAAAPTNDVLFYNLGLIYRAAGLVERSQRAFERAAELNPRHLSNGTGTRPADQLPAAAEAIQWHRAAVADARTGARPAGIAVGSAADHRRLERLLAGTGTGGLAAGHRRCAEEIERGITPPGSCDTLVRPDRLLP